MSNEKPDYEDCTRRLLAAYDGFMASDYKAHLSNPAWLKLSDEFHQARLLVFPLDEEDEASR